MMSDAMDVIVPLEQEGTKAVVLTWFKAVGETVAENEPLVELETDKVAVEIPSPAAGVLAEILLPVQAEATPGAVLGRLRAGAPQAVAPPASPTAPASLSPPQAAGELLEQEHRLSPASRRAVRELGVDPASIVGTGRSGRITRHDVEEAAAARDALKSLTTEARPLVAPTPPAAQAVEPAAGGRPRSRLIPHDRMRRLIAENMLHSVTVAPHVTAVFEVDFSAVVAHRKANKAKFEQDGVALTYTAYIVHACVAAMRAAPTVNSRWRDDHLEVFDDINIGVGAALGDKGLIVPVIHNVQELSLHGIAARLQTLTAAARANKLKAADVQGGTFTISNHGVSGSLVAAPIIINQPQSAILGVGKMEKRVVVREVNGADALQILPMSYVSLTIDHRVLDGHQTNLWLSTFKETLETYK